MQVTPSTPHAAGATPVKHWPLSSQQPVQVVWLHRAIGLAVPHDGTTAKTKPRAAPSAIARRVGVLFICFSPNAVRALIPESAH
jgi:hypothetical protein